MNEDVRVVRGSSVHVAPAPNDGGIPIGHAWLLYPPAKGDELQFSGLLGPLLFDAVDLPSFVAERSAVQVDTATVADLLADARIMAIVRGRTEFGPRALGHRSLVAYPASAEMKVKLNKVKGRAWYRPVAPVVRADDLRFFRTDYHLDLDCTQLLTRLQCTYRSNSSVNSAATLSAPYMSFAPPLDDWALDAYPGIAHVDNTARVQTVNEKDNPWLYSLLLQLEKRTGAGIIGNTSFNRRGHPILNSIVDALQTFDEEAELSALVIEDWLFETRMSREP